MIKGLAITPPVIGRISIGHMIEKNGHRLPQKDDQFTITTQIQNQNGWLIHPIDKDIRQKSDNNKIRSIPVNLLFNDPDLNLRVEYTLFDRQSGRPMCAGNGELCRRHTQSGIEQLPCPSPELCELAKGGQCKPYGRLNVKIGEGDELGTFIFRTTGFNSIRTLAARLNYYQAVSGNLLSCLPLELRLRGKSTTQSYRQPIYYADLTIRSEMSLEEAIREARETDSQRKASGYQQEALEQAAQQGFSNAVFEDNEEEIPDIVEEFYPNANDSKGHERDAAPSVNTVTKTKPSLKDKLNSKAAEAASIN